MVKMVAPVNWAKVWSTDERMCRSLWTFALSLVKSTQIMTDMQVSIGFGENNNSCTPICGLIYFADDTLCFHSIQFLADLWN